jgi:hypothetical protein
MARYTLFLYPVVDTELFPHRHHQVVSGLLLLEPISFGVSVTSPTILEQISTKT